MHTIMSNGDSCTHVHVCLPLYITFHMRQSNSLFRISFHFVPRDNITRGLDIYEPIKSPTAKKIVSPMDDHA